MLPQKALIIHQTRQARTDSLSDVITMSCTFNSTLLFNLF